MARRSDLGVDSLDLLLDTICNVFGGIILMAILVVLQTQTSAGRIPEPATEDVQRTVEAQRLRFECERLANRATNLAQHRDAVAGTFQATTSPTGERLADAQGAFRMAIEEAQRRVKTTEAEVAASRRDHTKSEDLLRTAESGLKDKHAEVRSLEKEVEQLPTTASKQVRLPHRRGIVAGEAKYFMILASRAYYVGYRHRGHHHLHVEADDVADPPPAIYEQAVRITPRAGGGFAVPENVQPGDAVDRLLSAYRPANDYFVFLVCNDSPSFAAFQRFKAAVVASGFHHVVFPTVAENGMITVEPWLFHESE
jgi:hypothetical protein